MDMRDRPSHPKLPRGFWYSVGIGSALVIALAVAIGHFSGIFHTTDFRTVDGSADANVLVWEDVNGNGMRDPGEQPLSQITVSLGYAVDVTDSNGRASVWVFKPGCASRCWDGEFVSVETPFGYEATTPTQVELTGSGRTYAFGFAPLPGFPTATPQPPPPECISYQLDWGRQFDLTDLAITADGAVWVATYGGGVSRYAPDRDEWVFHAAEDGLASDSVRSITTDGNVVWFATTGGASRFDGTEWVSYRQSDGLACEDVYEIAIGPDGSVWFATDCGTTRFEPEANRWTSYDTSDGLLDDFVYYVATTPDGSVWFATLVGVSRLVVPGTVNEPPRWVQYTHSGSSSDTGPFLGVNDIDVAPDGTYWFGSLGGLIHFDPGTETWVVLDHDTTGYQFDGVVYDLAVAPDGSLWIGSRHLDLAAIYHLIPASDRDSEDVWAVYDAHDDLPGAADSVEAVAVSVNDVVWVGTREGAMRCVFPGR